MKRHRVASVRGSFLLEALVALVVFSLALLGLASGVAAALRQAGAAQWRGEAVDLAAATLARMSTADPVTLADRYGSDSGDEYLALVARAMHLPGVSATTNAPQVEIRDEADARNVRVTLYWQLPGDARAHQVSVAGVMPRP
jgi:type IV pilus assembly protein PilV